MSTGAMVRMARRSGEDFVYQTFDEGSRDAYQDVQYEADTSPPTIRGMRSDGSNRTFMLPTGEQRKVDIAVLIPSPVKDQNGTALNITFVPIQDDMTDRAATLTDKSGRIYKIVGVGHEAETPVGAMRLLCMRQAN
jgi:hypothetical protein